MIARKPYLVKDARPAVWMTLIAGLLMAALSAAGLLLPAVFYPSEPLRRAFAANDAANLAVGLPFLVGCLALAWLRKRLGLLLWPGALLYILYNYIAYSFALGSTPASLAYLALAAAGLTGIAQWATSMDAEAVKRDLDGRVPARFCGGVLAAFGILFLLMGIGKAWTAASGAALLSAPETAVLAADFLILPAWIVGGILLVRRHALGYLAGAGLLSQAVLLFAGLLVYFLTLPWLTGAEFPATDFAVIAGMSVIGLAPWALFLRGAIGAERDAG